MEPSYSPFSLWTRKRGDLHSAKRDRQLEAEAHERLTTLPGHPSDAGRRSRLLDIPDTLLGREGVPAGAAVLPARFHTFSPIPRLPDGWVRVPCLSSPSSWEREEVRSGQTCLTLISPRPCARPCYSFLGLLLQFSVFLPHLFNAEIPLKCLFFHRFLQVQIKLLFSL